MIHDKVTDWFINRKMLFLERFISEHCIQGKSLDVGCNYGFFSEYLAKIGFNSYGIDIKKEYFPKKGKAHYSMQSAEKMNFKDESFDLIICFDTIEHIKDKEDALSEIRRVLKKDGFFICTVPNIFSYFYMRSFLTFGLRGYDIFNNVHYQRTLWDWTKLLKQYFEIIEIKPILSIPFVEPKLVSQSFLNDFEYNKQFLSWISSDPMIICKKKCKVCRLWEIEHLK